MCVHQPPCPSAELSARAAARTVVAYPEQGWSLLCNAVIAFDDGLLLPDGSAVAPPRPQSTAGPVLTTAVERDEVHGRVLSTVAAERRTGCTSKRPAGGRGPAGELRHPMPLGVRPGQRRQTA